jgi:hypothetical protein
VAPSTLCSRCIGQGAARSNTNSIVARLERPRLQPLILMDQNCNLSTCKPACQSVCLSKVSTGAWTSTAAQTSGKRGHESSATHCLPKVSQAGHSLLEKNRQLNGPLLNPSHRECSQQHWRYESVQPACCNTTAKAIASLKPDDAECQLHLRTEHEQAKMLGKHMTCSSMQPVTIGESDFFVPRRLLAACLQHRGVNMSTQALAQARNV